MKLEDKDILECCKSNNYRAIIDLKEDKIGIQPKVRAVFFPNAVDHFLHEQSDDKGVYWIPRKGNEKLEFELLQLSDTLLKPKQMLKPKEMELEVVETKTK